MITNELSTDNEELNVITPNSHCHSFPTLPQYSGQLLKILWKINPELTVQFKGRAV